MVDVFSIALTHFLLAVAILRISGRNDLDIEGAVEKPKRRAGRNGKASSQGSR